MSYEGRISKQSQEHPSGWAPDSGKPACGWPKAFALSAVVIALFYCLCWIGHWAGF